jgi:CheY-like chemotaxis protein
MKPCVLVVDDEMMNRDLLRKVLVKEGLAVVEARDGTEALAALEKTSVDLVLMDLMMPGMDGFECSERIRCQSRYTALPLLAVTALNDRDSLQRAVGLGVDACIVKPYDLALLVKIVKHAIEGGRDALCRSVT